MVGRRPGRERNPDHRGRDRSRGRLEDPGTRDPRDLLRGPGLFRNGILWRAAVALFRNEERIRFDMPQCLLRVARFDGIDRTEFLDNRQFTETPFRSSEPPNVSCATACPLPGASRRGASSESTNRSFLPLATREALANAICHRDDSIGGGSDGLAIHDDRLEITSIGTLHFGLTPEKLFLPHESVPWTPLIADCVYRRGIIEHWGRGTLKMAEPVTAAGLPSPEIADVGGTVTVRFRHNASPVRVAGRLQISGIGATGAKVAALNEAQRTVFDLLTQAKHPLALREFRAELPESVSSRQVKRALARLKELELASSTGHGVSARWRARNEKHAPWDRSHGVQ